MALFNLNSNKTESNKTELNKDIISLIRRTWLSVWLHSFLYYCLDKSIISDVEWNKRAKRLAELVKEYPVEASTIKHYELFKDFDGSTGFDIANKATRKLKNKAHMLLEYTNND